MNIKLMDMEEIKASDLMIGNRIFRKYYNPEPNNETYAYHEVQVIGIYKDTIYCTPIDSKQILKIKDAYPIPLTEDILLKAGAKRLGENKVAIMLNDPSTHLILMRIGTHWYPEIEQIGEFISDGVNTVHLNFIDYVHQAQRLFKSLTGNDLKIEV
ncbi:hypothetical protein JCM30204_22500 [Dysgonomonas termitidis]